MYSSDASSEANLKETEFVRGLRRSNDQGLDVANIAVMACHGDGYSFQYSCRHIDMKSTNRGLCFFGSLPIPDMCKIGLESMYLGYISASF